GSACRDAPSRSRAGRADDRAFRYVAGTEGQGAAAHAGEDDEVDAVGRRPKPRDRPGVGPRPRLCAGFATERALPGPLQEALRELGLGVNPHAVTQLPHADRGEYHRGQEGERAAFQIARLKARRARTSAAASAAASRSATRPTVWDS